MLRTITWAQFLEWEAFCEIEPIGDLRGDFRMAHSMQLLANINRNSKTRPKPFTVMDFMFDFEEEEEQKPKAVAQSAAYIESVIRGWIIVSNAEFAPKEEGATQSG